jgi:hypothetical protein
VDLIFYGEPYPYQASLSDVRVILAIMRVLMMELPCQAVTGQILGLKCLLSSACGRLWLRLILSGIEWPRGPRIPTLGSLAQYW